MNTETNIHWLPTALLKQAEPFRHISDQLLKDIVGIAKLNVYSQGHVVYDVGDVADEVYVIVSGKVKIEFAGASAGATTLVKTLGREDVFGWAALFKDDPHSTQKRIARVVCVEEATVLAINSNALTRLFKSDPAAHKDMMSSFVNMIVREASIPGRLLKFADMDGKLVPVQIPSSRVDALLNNPVIDNADIY